MLLEGDDFFLHQNNPIKNKKMLVKAKNKWLNLEVDGEVEEQVLGAEM